MQSVPAFTDFLDAPWNAPLDPQAAIDAIPEQATISGMFVAPLVATARQMGRELSGARHRYISFQFYPLKEHAALLVETCQLLYPGRPLRQALRKLGRGAPKALVSSTLGKVMLGSAEGVHAVLKGMAKAYGINAPPSRASLLEIGSGYAIVRLEEIHYFLDCHHVGTFEGALRFAGVDGSVKLRAHGEASADMLCQWRT
jgi:uncharacterized protein (TIGR02265 family)